MEIMHSLILAMGSPSAPGTESTAPSWAPLLPFVLVFVIFYLILIRPQKKQQQELQKLMESLKPGDQILMSNGIYGTVVDTKEKSLTVKIADNVKIKVLRTAVASVVNGDEKKNEKQVAAAK
jgi:preprotein translocase subunit YajC